MLRKRRDRAKRLECFEAVPALGESSGDREIDQPVLGDQRNARVLEIVDEAVGRTTRGRVRPRAADGGDLDSEVRELPLRPSRLAPTRGGRGRCVSRARMGTTARRQQACTHTEQEEQKPDAHVLPGLDA